MPDPCPPPTNGWNRYEALVLAKLDELTHAVRSLERRAAEAEARDAALAVKAGAWGLIAGAIPAAIAVVWNLTR